MYPRYIHLNPVSAHLIEVKSLGNYPWSSFPAYTHEGKDLFINRFTNTRFVLSYFKTKDAYKKFVFDQADYQRELQRIKRFILEE